MRIHVLHVCFFVHDIHKIKKSAKITCYLHVHTCIYRMHNYDVWSSPMQSRDGDPVLVIHQPLFHMSTNQAADSEPLSACRGTCIYMCMCMCTQLCRLVDGYLYYTCIFITQGVNVNWPCANVKVAHLHSTLHDFCDNFCDTCIYMYLV